MSKTILIVDDSASLRSVVKMALVSAGYIVLEAGNGSSALAMLASAAPDMIVSDLNMPGMGGLEFASKVKMIPRYKFIPILMLTTEVSQSKKDEAKAAGVKAWMTKPFVTTSLVAAIQKLCP